MEGTQARRPLAPLSDSLLDVKAPLVSVASARVALATVGQVSEDATTRGGRRHLRRGSRHETALLLPAKPANGLG